MSKNSGELDGYTARSSRKFGTPCLSWLQNMGIDQGGAHNFMAQPCLNGTDVRASLEQMGGRTVAQWVGGDRLGEASPVHGPFDGLVDGAGIAVMAPHDAAARVGRTVARR